ncbi:MAG TPA: PilZ domain-containing protein, partial [Acidimicrobiales bacterium]
PKGGADARHRGRPPRILWGLTTVVAGICAYAVAGVAGVVPWRTTTTSTVSSGLWLALAGVVLVTGLRRIRAAEYATSRRNAPRIPFSTPVQVDGTPADLVDVSVGGAAIRLSSGSVAMAGLVLLDLPGQPGVKMEVVGAGQETPGPRERIVSLRIADNDWESHAKLSRWLFHTPLGAVPALPPGVPVAAALGG